MKSGIKTTEFWMAAIAQVVGILALFGVVEPAKSSLIVEAVQQIAGGLIMGLSALGYSISRGQAKKGG